MRTLPRLLASSVVLLLSLLPAAPPASATPPRQPHAGALSLALDRLGHLGSVLYVAAHPDDENTRLLAHLAGTGWRAAYLSLTRGDGGQNLVGTEQDELLGLLRTHELLAARRIDGAEQWFTRARDFGYSKSADETLRIWGREQVLADVVWVIRQVRPVTIVTRFNTKPPNHGHHTASALLAEEAFRAAADPKRFPEQLRHVQPWQATRLVHNVSTWNLPKDADLSQFLQKDLGGYEPRLGRSWGEIAAESRSQHKSQGFGVAAQRGTAKEPFAIVAGAPVAPNGDFFGTGPKPTWGGSAKDDAVLRAIEAATNGFDAKEPARSLPQLAKVHAAIAALPASHPWRAIKLQETEAVMLACAGLHLEARAPTPTAMPGQPVTVALTALNRSAAKVQLVSVQLPGSAAEKLDAALALDLAETLTRTVTLPADAAVSTPYWLRDPADGELDHVTDPRLLGRPEGEPALAATFTLEVAGRRFAVTRPVSYVWVDPVRGELARPFEVAPAVTAQLDRTVVMVPNGRPQALVVTLAAGRDGVAGTLQLEVPAGWQVAPAKVPFQLAKAGAQQTVAFSLTPPAHAQPGRLRAVTVVDGQPSSWQAQTVTYDHVPPLTVRQPAEAALVPLQLATGGRRLGYVPGPGDRVAESLAAVGYDVTVLREERLAREPLERYDAILVGVRALNAQPRLGTLHDKLMRYVEQGGRLVVQYQTNSRVGPLTVPVGPYPLEIGRDRVTDETAALTPLDPRDPVLTAPNRLGPADFAGWVQERGLYFGATWDPRYKPVFALQDPGEKPLQGGLLVARHGKGTFVYTGLAFFRQLPAGVPGAYRLLANVLAR